MKKKVVLTIVFIISLLPMLLNQYGGARGVQEITGLINLLNPIGIVSVMLFAVGVWIPFRMKLIGKVLGASGVIGIVLSPGLRHRFQRLHHQFRCSRHHRKHAAASAAI